MDAVISLLFLSLIPQVVVPEVPTMTSYRATVEIVSGSSRIFSGERLLLRCNIADVYNNSWNYQWFRGSVQLPPSGKTLLLWKANIQDSGKYSCQGSRETEIGNKKTQKSLPEEIHVDGGFVILEMPQHPILVGDVLDLKCRLRGNAPVRQTILYRDGIVVKVQRGSSLYFRLINVSLEDEGRYSCRVSWDLNRRTHSVMSLPTPVNVLEVLTQPAMEIDDESPYVEANKMRLICHHMYNARPPAPSVNYYFYKNNNLLAPASSLNHIHVRRAPGWYSCKAKVPKLNIVRWSEPKGFGEVPGLQTMPPQHHHRHQMPSFPAVSAPRFPSDPSTHAVTSKHFDATTSFDQDAETFKQSSIPSELPFTTSQPPPDQFPGLTEAEKP